MRVRALVVLIASVVAGGCSSGAEREGPTRQREPNPPSIGFLDVPTANAVVETRVVVAGWALDESGVRLVRIYFDDQLMASVRPATVRRDVEAQFPERRTADGVHGFDAVIDAGSHSGYTTIRAEAIDNKGGLTPIGSVTVKIK